MADSQPGDPLNDSGAAPDVWVSWYFTRRFWTLLTAPLFAIMAYALIISVFDAFIQGFGLVKVLVAVWGWWVLLLPLLYVGWGLISLPPMLYYSLLKNLPGLWIRQDASRTAKLLTSFGMMVGLPLIAWLIFHTMAYGIGWIADTDPCAAFEAGVTGTIPPTGCY